MLFLVVKQNSVNVVFSKTKQYVYFVFVKQNSVDVVLVKQNNAMDRREELTAKANELTKAITNELHTFYKYADGLVKTYIGEDYYVEIEEAVTTTFVIAYANLVDDIKVYMCLNHGNQYDFNTDTTKFVYELLAYNGGKIDLDNEHSERYIYNHVVSTFIENKTFRDALRVVLFGFAETIKGYESELTKVRKEIAAIDLEIAKEKSRIRNEEEFEKTCAHLYTASADELALIKKGCGGRFIYRGHPVQVCDFSTM